MLETRVSIIDSTHQLTIDVSLLYVDKAHPTTAIFLFQRGEVTCIELKGKKDLELGATAETQGAERVVAILAEAQPDTRLHFLADANSQSTNRDNTSKRKSTICNTFV